MNVLEHVPLALRLFQEECDERGHLGLYPGRKVTLGMTLDGSLYVRNEDETIWLSLVVAKGQAGGACVSTRERPGWSRAEEVRR